MVNTNPEKDLRDSAPSQAEELAELSRALGHPARVAILRYLYDQQACVCGRIVDLLPLAQSTVSQHLKKLKDAGWISGEVDGPRTCYCIRPEAVTRFMSAIHQLFQPKRNMIMESAEEIRAVVREKYAEAASGGSCCSGSCCGGAADADEIAQQVGYTLEELKTIPEGANLGLGCGNPIEYAQLQPGETVLDLGSGAGIDCLLAARAVGETGKVIGVDMTPQMLEKARRNAARAGFTHVDFRLGEIEHLPVADQSVDVIISNCVINLSPDKAQVLREAVRVLKPGGRMLVSDLVLRKPLSDDLKNSVEAYVGCVAGAWQKEDYVALFRDAGLKDVKIVDERVYDAGLGEIDMDLRLEALESVISVKVRAVKA